jgi:hypothetical protein
MTMKPDVKASYLALLDARRTFLENNRPRCIGTLVQHPVHVIVVTKRVGRCNSTAPVRLVERLIPAHWMCPSCRRSWTFEPEPPDACA